MRVSDRVGGTYVEFPKSGTKALRQVGANFDIAQDLRGRLEGLTDDATRMIVIASWFASNVNLTPVEYEYLLESFGLQEVPQPMGGTVLAIKEAA